MVDLGFVARCGKVVANLVGDHYRTVLSAGAPEGDGQVALPFTDVMWQQVDEQVGNSRNKFDGLRKRPDIFGDTWIFSGEIEAYRVELKNPSIGCVPMLPRIWLRY